MTGFIRLALALVLTCGTSLSSIAATAAVATDQVFPLSTTNAAAASDTNFTWAPDTLAYALVTNLQARTHQLRNRGLAFTNSLPMFTNWWFCLNGCGRNPDFWLRNCAGYTASSVWNCMPPGFMINYTALSPRHIISSGHTGSTTNNCEIHFVTKNNVLITNHVIGGLHLPSENSAALWVGLLASNLPPAIEVVRVVPPNFYSYFSPAASNNLFRAYGQPDFAPLLSCQDRWIWPMAMPVHSVRAGDSGSPIYVLIETNLVLYAILSGAEIIPNFSLIQSAMDKLSASHSAPQFNLSTEDLSKFPVVR